MRGNDCDILCGGIYCTYYKEMFFEKEHIGNLLIYHEEREVDD